MPDLNFQVEKAEPAPYSVAPLMVFKLRITDVEASSVTSIHSVALRCQIRIEPVRRRYSAEAQEKLFELFGPPQQWSRTLHSMLWTHASVLVPPFTGSTLVDLPVPCTYDFNVAGTKYFAGLEDGEVPLCLLFSGTIFYAGEGGALQVAQIPWEKEADFRLPVPVWKDMMEIYYPNSAWLCLRKDIVDRLSEYKRQHGLPTWEQAMESLLAAEQGVPR